MAAPKTIVFDFDGTLADTFAALFTALNLVSDQHGIAKVAESDVARLRGLEVRQILSELKISLIRLPFVVRDVRRAVESEVHKLKSFSGLEDSLRSLHQAGYTLGILTSNSERNVDTFLRTHDWLKYFSFIFAGSSVFGKHKMIRRLLADRALDSQSAIYVGDETRDIEAARKAGLRCVAVSWGFSLSAALAALQPERLIADPKELPSAVSSLFV